MNNESKKLTDEDIEILKDLKEAIKTIEKSTKNPDFEKIKKEVETRSENEMKTKWQCVFYVKLPVIFIYLFYICYLGGH